MSKVSDAFAVLQQALNDDPDYAYGWHSNIAMVCMDAIDDSTGIKCSHKIGNDAASRFMKICFDVETKHK